MENWKLVIEFDKVHSKLYLPSDKIYVSDKGNVKFNDIELSLDYGLYVKGVGSGNKQYDIMVPLFSWPEGTLYRTIYKTFIGEIKKGMHIHHKDFDHLNNNVDNLIQVTFKEHRHLHKGIERDKDLYKLEEQTKESYNKFYNYLKERYTEYCKQLEQQKQKEIEDKIASGKYKYSKTGVLRPTKTAKKGYVTPDEVRKKQSEALKKLYAENEEYRNTNKTLKCTGKGCKYVMGDDGKKHRIYAA